VYLLVKTNFVFICYSGKLINPFTSKSQMTEETRKMRLVNGLQCQITTACKLRRHNSW